MVTMPRPSRSKNSLRSPMVLALAAAALAGCAADGAGGEHEAPVGPESGSTCPDGSKLTYGTFGREFVDTYCTTCHSTAREGADRNGAPSDHNFDSLEMLQEAENLEHVDQVAAAGPDSANTAMPPSGPKPSTLERQKLGEWLACGAP